MDETSSKRRHVPVASTSDSQSSTSLQDESKESECQKRETRITKDNLYMVLALWMEMFPSSSSESKLHLEAKKVGVVFVLPSDRVLAADCSRDGLHGIARVLITHSGKLQGCKVFVSRKPCSLCAKLLVQARVSRVFYLPIEPESEIQGELDRVDNLFKNSTVDQSVFVPCVEERVLTKEEKKLPEEITPSDIGVCRDELFKKWWKPCWIERAPKCLPWPSLDNKMKKQVEEDFRSLMKWIAVVKTPLDKGVTFKKVSISDDSRVIRSNDAEEYPDRDVAYHWMVFAKMLARQTDDPKTGVGAVILKDREIATLGWNGFPSKALYGEFPRASDDDNAIETKFPYVIHAEQNALLVRNLKDLTNGVMFITKSPCDECAPMVKLSGVRTVVVGEAIDRSQGGILTYNLIKKYTKDGDFSCFEMETVKTSAKRSATDPELRKKLKSA